MKAYPEYCAVIRTLGTAGEAYQRELDSLARQSIKPKRILVYIAEDYELPKETIGIETYIRCPKGMMTQRSLSFDEVDCDWILFLDDDIYLPNDGVQRLFDGIFDNDGDCIAPATFEHAKASFIKKLMYAAIFQTYPHTRRDWAFRVRIDGGNSYNYNPKKDVLLSESAPGTCCLCRKSSYLSVNMRNECWIDSFGYPWGEDLMFYHKMYVHGCRLLIYFNSGIVHLDARSSQNKNIKAQNRITRTLRFVNWYRICYSKQKTLVAKFWCVFLYGIRTLISIIFHLLYGIVTLKPYYFTNMLLSTSRGLKYVRSEEYKKYPSFYD